MGFHKQFVMIGHRGAAALAPENTLAGFRLAERLGADAVELDVRLVAGRLAVIHDAALDRTTTGSGKVEDKSWAEIQSFDAGNGECIPELPQVFSALGGCMGVNIELKGRGTGAALAGLLHGNPPAQPMLVSSFCMRELEAFHQAHRQVDIGLLVANAQSIEHRIQKAIDMGAWSVHLHDSLATPGRISAIRDQGLQVLVYTVNDRKRCEALRRQGARGVFSDYPDLVKR